MKIVVIGHTGFVGRAVFQHLIKTENEIVGINSQSPQIDMVCDLIINCAGNSKKFLAEKNYDLVRLIEDKVLDRLKRIKTKKIIHISSITTEEENNYGSLKRYVEEEIKMIFPDFCILRLGSLVGDNLVKNVVYDLLNNNSLYVKLGSTYNFIHTSTIAELVEHLVKYWKSQETINVAATTSISVGEIASMMKKIPQVQEIAKTEYYQIDTNKLQAFFETRDSKYYINQYLRNLRLENR